MRRAFVTGGTGFVGIHLIRLLVEQGWSVTALHRATSDLTPIEGLNVDFRVGSITDRESLMQAVPDSVDVIFHVAANTNFWRVNNDMQTRDNVEGTQNMVDVALKKHASRFIHTSSLAAFGLHHQPINEQTISTASRSHINYVRTKWLAEQVVHEGGRRGLDAVIINPCNIIGQYDYRNWSQIFSLINNRKLPGVPSGAGTFCCVKEVAKAHITAVERGRSGENYILGGVDATYQEFTSTIAQLLGERTPRVIPNLLLHLAAQIALWMSYLTRHEPNITPEKVAVMTNWNVSNSSKAGSELGYKAVPLRIMLEECYAWIRRSELLS